MTNAMKVCFAALVCVGLTACNGKTPLNTSLQEIQDNYVVDGLFSPPREKVSLGTVFRERDKLPLETKCFEGTPVEGKVLSLTANSGKYDDKASFLAEWSDLLGLDINFDKVTEVEVKYGGFSESYLDKVRPTRDPECPHDVYMGKAKLFAGLIKTDKIEIVFKETSEKKVDLSISKLKQLANVDLKAGAQINKNKNLEFSGKNLFVAYREMDYEFKSTDVTEQMSQGETESMADYDITLRKVELVNGEPTATVTYRNLDFSPPVNVTKTLKPEDLILIKELPKQLHYLGVRTVDPAENEAEIFISIRQWSLENGPQALSKRK